MSFGASLRIDRLQKRVNCISRACPAREPNLPKLNSAASLRSKVLPNPEQALLQDEALMKCVEDSSQSLISAESVLQEIRKSRQSRTKSRIQERASIEEQLLKGKEAMGGACQRLDLQKTIQLKFLQLQRDVQSFNQQTQQDEGRHLQLMDKALARTRQSIQKMKAHNKEQEGSWQSLRVQLQKQLKLSEQFHSANESIEEKVMARLEEVRINLTKSIEQSKARRQERESSVLGSLEELLDKGCPK